MISLWLPFPPSLNSLYPGKVRRHKSKKYEQWIYEAKRGLAQQHFICFHMPVGISYKFGRPDKRKRDLDNLFKACNDLLVDVKAISDDSIIHRISGEWADIDGCCVTIQEI